MTYTFNDKDKILPILAQDILLDKVSNHPIDQPFSIIEFCLIQKRKWAYPI